MSNDTVKAMMENFEEMLVEMPFNKVTVSALVDRCEISANTFYYHFQDIYGLLDQWLTIKVNQYFNFDDEDQDWADCLKALLKAMQTNSRMIYHIWGAISKERLEQAVFGPVQDWFCILVKKRHICDGVSEDFVQDVAEFYCYSILGFVLKFIWDHMQSDVDQAVDRFSGILRGTRDYMLAAEKGDAARAEPQ